MSFSSTSLPSSSASTPCSSRHLSRHVQSFLRSILPPSTTTHADPAPRTSNPAAQTTEATSSSTACSSAAEPIFGNVSVGVDPTQKHPGESDGAAAPLANEIGGDEPWRPTQREHLGARLQHLREHWQRWCGHLEPQALPVKPPAPSKEFKVQAETHGFAVLAPSSSASSSSTSSSTRTPFLVRLAQHQSFRNPYSTAQMAKALHVDLLDSLILETDEEPEDYLSIRKKQERKYVSDCVVKGVALSRQGNYADAVKYYNYAIEYQPKNIDAHVGRGAAYANLARYDEAITEFKTALDIDPDNINANKYLTATREKVKRLAEEAAAAAEPPKSPLSAGGSAQPGNADETNPNAIATSSSSSSSAASNIRILSFYAAFRAMTFFSPNSC